VIVGARSILLIAPLATILGTIFGTAIGLVTGYYRGFVDEATMRLVDAILAVPLIITALLAVVAIGPSRLTLILVIGFVFTPIIAKTVRAAVLGEAQLEYVQAARLRNERGPYVMFAEILPNVTGPIIVEFTVRLGYAIFTVATLSFLGFGADPSIPDWGQDISQHYQFINGGVWWAVLFPSLAIATLIIGINLIADAIAQVFER
jgi:peptide/nickel transport system permease protein